MVNETSGSDTYTNIDRNGCEGSRCSLLTMSLEWQARQACTASNRHRSFSCDSAAKCGTWASIRCITIWSCNQGRASWFTETLSRWWSINPGSTARWIFHRASSEALESILSWCHSKIQMAFIHHQAIVSGELSKSEHGGWKYWVDGVHRFFNIWWQCDYLERSASRSGCAEDVTQKVMLEKRLVHQANYDEMTDLLNRRAIYEWLREHLASALISHVCCWILMILNRSMILTGIWWVTRLFCALANITKRNVEKGWCDGSMGRWKNSLYLSLTRHLKFLIKSLIWFANSLIKPNFKIDEQVRFNVSVWVSEWVIVGTAKALFLSTRWLT